MTTLALIIFLLGALQLFLGLVILGAPERFRQWTLRFPRHKPAAWGLTAIDVAWVYILLRALPLGRYENLRPLIHVLAPVSFFLMVRYMDELLAPRALGGLLLLVATPILDHARWHPSAWRYVPIVMAYIMVIKGMTLVLSPHYFRRAVSFWTGRSRLLRAAAVAALGVGAGLVTLAFARFNT